MFEVGCIMNWVNIIRPHLKLVNVVCVTIGCQHMDMDPKKSKIRSVFYCNLMPSWGRVFSCPSVRVEFGVL